VVNFGPNDRLHSVPVVSDESDAIESQTVPSFDGLHWENGTEITQPPQGKMMSTATKLRESHSHLFSTPIDSMFAMLPYTFWELMVLEINRYASQFLVEKKTTYVTGYLWQPVSVSDMLTYFGILIHSMLFPQTGRRMRDAWDDASRNPWTSYMGKGRYLQITSMLHFNNNEDVEGMARDSLHKIRPLLNIVKKTVGRYAVPGSEFSFDEATMACFSRYGRGLVSFNPMKPTGKFHFKMYMVCCASTNLTLKFKIHTKDGAEDNVEDAPGAEEESEDKTMINKIDKLTMGMCEILYNSGTTVNMDNYYMSTVCAVHLKSKGVY
jgi:hypothetical protein